MHQITFMLFSTHCTNFDILGWGHASENPRLPEALNARGIIFIGPPSNAMFALVSLFNTFVSYFRLFRETKSQVQSLRRQSKCQRLSGPAADLPPMVWTWLRKSPNLTVFANWPMSTHMKMAWRRCAKKISHIQVPLISFNLKHYFMYCKTESMTRASKNNPSLFNYKTSGPILQLEAFFTLVP